MPQTAPRRLRTSRKWYRRRVCASEKRCTGIFGARTGHRFYNSDDGRWLNRDPIGEQGGLNEYGFVNNTPTFYVDLLGLSGGTGGGFVWPTVTPPSMPYYPPVQKPKPPVNAPGFAICQRNIKYDDCNFQNCIGNALAWGANQIGGQHAYVQYIDPDGNKWGYGFAKPGVAPEKAFKPNSCKTCTITSGTLSNGSGKGKPANTATVAEIQDCIKNHKPTKPYKALGYNCNAWAGQAAKACGLDCK